MALVQRIAEYRPRHAAVAEIPDPPSTSNQFSNNFVSTHYYQTHSSPVRPNHKLEPGASQQAPLAIDDLGAVVPLKDWSYYDVTYASKDEPFATHRHTSRTNSMGSSPDDSNSLYSHPLTRHTSVTSSASASPNGYKQSLPPLPSETLSSHRQHTQASRHAAANAAFGSFPRPQHLADLAYSLSPKSRATRAPSVNTTHENQTQSPPEMAEPCIPPMVPYSYHPRVYGNATPPQVYGHTSTTVGSKIFTFGGTDGSECSNSMYSFDTDSHSLKKVDKHVRPRAIRTIPRPVFRQKAREQQSPQNTRPTPPLIPSPRKFHTGTTTYTTPIPGVPQGQVPKEIFFFGGGDNTQCFNDSYMYNTRTGGFRAVADGEDVLRPSPRMGHVTINYGQCFYVHGGHNPYTGQTFSDMWRFDPKSCLWSEIFYNNPDSAPTAVAYHDGCLVSDSSFVYYGGKSANGTVLADMMRFNPETATWSCIPTFIYNKFTGQGMRVSLGRYGHKIMNGGKWVYILGGDNGDGQVTDMWILSLATGVMIRSSYYGVLLKGLSHHTNGFCDGRLYFFGGVNTAGERPEVVCEIRCIELPLSGTCMKEFV